MDDGSEVRTEVAGPQPGDGAAPDKAKPPAGRSPFASLLGDVTYLMVRSPSHRHLFLADLEWLVLPALTARQFRVFVNGATPYAYASWAFLDEEAEARLLSGQPRLRPGDWKSGDRAWLIDLVAPFGGAEGLARSIKAQAFADRTLKALRPRADGKGFEGVEVMAQAGSDDGKPIPSSDRAQ